MRNLFVSVALVLGAVVSVQGLRAQAAPVEGSATAPGARVSVGAAIDELTKQSMARCPAAVAAASAPGMSVEQDARAQGLVRICECMPHEIAHVFGTDRSVVLDADQAEDKKAMVIGVCGTRGMEQMLLPSCERGGGSASSASEPQPAAGSSRQAGCACLRAGMAQIDDDRLAEEELAEDRKRRAEHLNRQGFGHALKRIAASCGVPL